jgi:type IV pilus assembly protein PilB
VSPTHSPNNLVAVLERVPFLRACKPEDLFYLARHAEHRKHEAQDLLIEAGKPVKEVFVLLQGRAALILRNAAQRTQQQLERLRPGDLFGDTAFLLGTATPIAVVAETDCQTLTIQSKAFEKIIIRSPDLILALAHRAAARFVRVAMLGAGPGEATEPDVTQPRSAPSAPHPRDEGDSISWVDPSSYEITDELLSMIPTDLIRKHRMLPLRLGKESLRVGMVNPLSVEARQELTRVLHSVDPEIVAISADAFSQQYLALKLAPDEVRTKVDKGGMSAKPLYSAELEKKLDKSQAVMGSEVIGLFDRILIEGVERGASDIHIEPDATGVIVRYRIQGALYQRKEYISLSYAPAILTRIKVLAELDITDRRLPQDGRILVRLGNQELNLRISTMAVARGEKVVIRIIDSSDATRSLHQVFINKSQEKMVRSALAQPFGAVIVAGPTGSGKSSTLYAMLNERRMSRKDTNIVTVEDPVEYLLQGVSQVPIAPRIGFDFNAALRGLMRQDPDVIMIGELRDPETTSTMIEAALTGHLVLTSIHGNNTAAVIQRLQHMGINPILLSQGLSLVVAQRLSRKLCVNCAVEAAVAPALADSLIARKVLPKGGGATKLPRPVGCPSCHNTGYAGRIAVQEVLTLDDAVRAKLAENAPPAELVKAARKTGCFTSFADAAAHLMTRRLISPSDALLVVAE